MEVIVIQPISMISIRSRLEEAFKMVKMYHQLPVIHQIWEQLMYPKITMHTHHTQVLLIHMVMAARDTQDTITTISSNLIKPIHSLYEHIKIQVLLISLFPPFRILGLMLDLQIIQALITILLLLIIRLLEFTKTALDMQIKRHRGTMEAIQVMLLIRIQIIPQIPIALVLQLLQFSISNNNKIRGPTITTKQKSAVHQGQRICLSQVHPPLAVLFLQLLVVMQLQIASLNNHIHHIGGKTPVLLLCLLFRFEDYFLT